MGKNLSKAEIKKIMRKVVTEKLNFFKSGIKYSLPRLIPACPGVLTSSTIISKLWWGKYP